MSVHITTFGVLHGTEPDVPDPVRVDLTEALRNPADDPAMIEMTGLDGRVRAHVMGTPGAGLILERAVREIEGRLAAARVEVLVYCRGGRHRSVAMGEEISERLRGQDVEVFLVHRDVGKAVVR